MYKNFYKLTQNPFQLNANIDFFFNSIGHKRAKAYLRYGLVQGQGYVVVTGAPGTGKTMIVKELFKSLEEDTNIIYGLLVSSQVGAEDTLRMLATAFKITYEYTDKKAILLSRLETFFIENAKLGKRVLLVVDEAQNLPKESIEELRMLSNYEWENKVILQIFLVGQEELGKLLYSSDMEQVKQRIVATYHLKAIEEEEIEEYMVFRLTKAGWNKNPKFTEDVFSAIYRFTQGIPRRINTFCDRLLLFGYLEELSEINLSTVKHVISEVESDFDSLTVDIKTTTNLDYDLPKIAKIENIQNTYALTPDQRIELLEKKLADLTVILNKERALLRKAILIQLDMNDVFSE